jgi:hypothetical protein
MSAFPSLNLILDRPVSAHPGHSWRSATSPDADIDRFGGRGRNTRQYVGREWHAIEASNSCYACERAMSRVRYKWLRAPDLNVPGMRSARVVIECHS